MDTPRPTAQVLSVAVALLIAAVSAHALAAAQGDPAKDLKSKDAEVRLSAVDALASGTHDKAEKLLVSALKDKDWEVVERAADALAGIGGKASVSPLTKVALGGPAHRVRMAAARTLARIDAEAAYKGLSKKVSGDGAESACDAVALLGPELLEPVSVKSFAKALKSDEDRVRRAAARAVAAVPSKKRREKVDGFLASEHLGVVAGALEGIALRRDATDLTPVMAVLDRERLGDTLERRARAAAVSLIRSADPGLARAAVDDAIARSGSGDHAARFVRLVADLTRGDDAPLSLDRAVTGLEDSLGHTDEGVRAMAVRSLETLGSAGALSRAAKAMDDSSARVRLAALFALKRGRGADESSTRDWLLDRLRGDDDARVREEAAAALGVPGLDGVAASLAQAMTGDADKWVSVAAAVSLGKLRGDDHVDALAEAMNSAKDWRVRGAAVVGLGQTYSRDAMPHLVHALGDTSPAISRTAWEWLCTLAGYRVGRESAAWDTWLEGAGQGHRPTPPENEAARRARYGYGRPDHDLYAGLDVLVFESRGDHIQNVLAHLGLAHRLTSSNRIPRDEAHPRAIFVANCTGEMSAEDVEQLGWFLRTGGYLFGSCWALQETIHRVYPGVARRLETLGEVLDTVRCGPAAPDSAWLEGVFDGGVRPVYTLQGAYLIEVLQPERCEVLIDSVESAEHWGGGNMAAWWTVSHGTVLDSVNHFDLQGLALATHLRKPEERQAWALDHMGLSWSDWRNSRDEKYWSRATEAAREVRDLSVFRLLTNFVRAKRIAGEG